MNKGKAIEILKFYRDVDKAISLNERVINDLEDQYYNSVGAVNMDGMPHGKGGTSSPVETTVLHIPRSASRTIREMERENGKLEKIKSEILHELNRLNYHQKAVILGFYIRGLQWEQISEQTHYSPRQCRNIRDTALDRLTKRFTSNRMIANYRFPE
jgi:hypothetical protein